MLIATTKRPTSKEIFVQQQMDLPGIRYNARCSFACSLVFCSIPLTTYIPLHSPGHIRAESTATHPALEQNTLFGSLMNIELNYSTLFSTHLTHDDYVLLKVVSAPSQQNHAPTSTIARRTSAAKSGSSLSSLANAAFSSSSRFSFSIRCRTTSTTFSRTIWLRPDVSV